MIVSEGTAKAIIEPKRYKFRNWCTACQRSSLVENIHMLRLECQRCRKRTTLESEYYDLPPLGRSAAECQNWARRKFQESGLYALAVERGWWPSQKERWLYGDPLTPEPRWPVVGWDFGKIEASIVPMMSTYAGIPVVRNNYMSEGTVAVVEGSVVCADVDFERVKALFKNVKP